MKNHFRVPARIMITRFCFFEHTLSQNKFDYLIKGIKKRLDIPGFVREILVEDIKKAVLSNRNNKR